MTTKAELNARLIVPLTASRLKKTSTAKLSEMVEAQVAAATRVETLCDDPNGIPKPKPARRQPQTITVAARGEVKALRPGTIQAQVADLLRSGATMGDLRRVCIRKDGRVWADSAIRGLFSTDMRAHGYGVRTELWNGFQLWQNSSFDDNTSFAPAMMALENGHPDDNRDHDAILADAIANHGFDPTELYQVFFFIDPKA